LVRDGTGAKFTDAPDGLTKADDQMHRLERGAVARGIEPTERGAREVREFTRDGVARLVLQLETAAPKLGVGLLTLAHRKAAF
jgi:hypothetical protein